MGWPEISIEDFPPERDDEPTSLRQNILDELTDHFACALNRELLKNQNQQLARERVIKQFGDPIKVARQLWFDAMKEKIMSQRIMTGVSVVMAVCCIVVVGIAWSLMKESQAINQNLMAQLATIADRPEPVAVANMDQKILKQLDELERRQTAQEDSSSEEMNQISFQLVQEKVGGKPAAGFTGTLAKIENGNKIFNVNAVSDAKGLLDFGKLPWGTYHMKLRAPWNQDLNMPNNISVIPGRKYEETIVCPAGAPEEVPVQFQVNWPSKPKGEASYLLCDFRYFIIDDRVKQSFYLEPIRSFQPRSVLPYSWWTYKCDLNKESVRGVYLIDVKNNRATPCPLAADGNFEDIDLQNLVWHPSVEILQGEYALPAIYLLSKSELSKLSELNSIKKISTFVRSDTGFGLGYYDNQRPYFGLIISPFEEFKIEPQLYKVLEKNDAIVRRLNGSLETMAKDVHGFRENRNNSVSGYSAKKDQANLWEIKIPDFELIFQESGSLNSAL